MPKDLAEKGNKLPPIKNAPEPIPDKKEYAEESEMDEEEMAGSLEGVRVKSMSSMASSKEALKGKELNESIFFKVRLVVGPVFGLIINFLVLLLVIQLYSENGVVIRFGGGFFRGSAGILFVLIMVGAYKITELQMVKGASAYFASKLVDKKGYSISCCAFMQSNLFEKVTFGSKLSFRSKARKILTRFGILWGVHGLAPMLGIFAGTQLVAHTSYVDTDNLACLIYEPVGSPTDRGWPTAIVEMGVGEYVFGASLGSLSSQDPVDVSTFVMPPQLIDASDDGSSVFGEGLIHTIETNCTCSYSKEASDLTTAGVPGDKIEQMLDHINTLNSTVGLVNAIEVAENRLIITSVLTGTAVCGRTNTTSLPMPVCKTHMYDQHVGIIQITYMTDGSPASIAAERVQIREHLQPYDLSWLENGFRVLLGNIGYIRLPPTFPGSVNPLLWWTSPNMQVVSPSLLENGLETTFAMFSKVVIQRTYSTRGNLCSQNMVTLETAEIFISVYGFVCGMIYMVFQLIINLVALFGYIPWMMSAAPIFPAFRLLTDEFYFTIMMSKPALSGLMSEIPTTAPQDLIWNAIDTTLRLGESIFTVDDPEIGEITLDKPKMVSSISTDKRYP